MSFSLSHGWWALRLTWSPQRRMGRRASRWLKPLLDRLGHKSRRRMCPLYVAGLIGPGDRRAFSQWRSGLRLAITTSCIILCGWRLGRGAIGDRAAHSSGSARWWQRRRVGNRRYGGAEEGQARSASLRSASALGKTANCQTLVSLTLARGEVPVMVALRLFFQTVGSTIGGG